MIILPHTPPTAQLLSEPSQKYPTELSVLRSVIAEKPVQSYNDLVRYVVDLQEYLEAIFVYLAGETESTDLKECVVRAADVLVASGAAVPWENVAFHAKNDTIKANLLKLSKKKKDWLLNYDTELAIVSLSLIYTRLGSELINELIDTEESPEELEKWKQVVTFYKKAISVILFGKEVNAALEEHAVPGELYVFLEKINHICIQMSILSKSSWINRGSYNADESFKTTNNGTLCRVAIFVLEELRSCKHIVDALSNSTSLVSLNTSDWKSYLDLVERYANAYAGFFLSIETYQQHKLGQAIGLVNFSLLNLQSKRMSEISPKKSKITRLKSKLSSHKNESYIKNLESITSLNLKSSVFNESSGIILRDISYLFNQLVQLHLKFTKENDNLNFDKVADYQAIGTDNKFPLGARIPVSDIAAFSPSALVRPAPKEQSTRSNYY